MLEIVSFVVIDRTICIIVKSCEKLGVEGMWLAIMCATCATHRSMLAQMWRHCSQSLHNIADVLEPGTLTGFERPIKEPYAKIESTVNSSSLSEVWNDS